MSRKLCSWAAIIAMIVAGSGIAALRLVYEVLRETQVQPVDQDYRAYRIDETRTLLLGNNGQFVVDWRSRAVLQLNRKRYVSLGVLVLWPRGEFQGAHFGDGVKLDDRFRFDFRTNGILRIEFPDGTRQRSIDLLGK